MREGRVSFVTLGCKVNQTESEAIASALGMQASAHSADDSDVVVINTCTVTGEADHKARKAVRHALARAGEPVVVVTGCLAALDADALRELGDRVVVEADKERVESRVREALAARHAEVSENQAAPAPSRTRAQLKIEDGCDTFCTYCIVPHARGVPRAVPLERLVGEARRLVASGVAEIVLTGINIGRYDHAGATLSDVLEAVSATGVQRVRLSSVEPGDLTDRLLEVAVATPAFCAHLHVPLQSGSDSVLRRMGRPYTTDTYADVLARARRAFPGIALSTDLIVGFPGETDEEFAETLAFVQAHAFSRLHVFRYSRRPGTPAADMPDQVSAEVKAERSAALRALGERLAVRYAASQAGTIAEVLVERIGEADAGTRFAEGTTREYLRVRAVPTGTTPATGSLVRVRLEPPSDDGEITGRIVG